MVSDGGESCFFFMGGRGGAGGGAGVLVACLHCHCGTRQGGLPSLLPACLFTLAYFLPPSPQPPSRREGGEYYFISPGATAPGTPATGWDAALAEPAVQETEGGRRGFGRLLTLPLVCFPAPIPPAPFPSGEGGAQKFISPGAPPPAPLQPGGMRHWHNFPLLA